MAMITGRDVAETHVVQVPGVTPDDFALLSGAIARVMERFGWASVPGAAVVIEEARVLCGPVRVVMGRDPEYGKCPQGSHWAGV